MERDLRIAVFGAAVMIGTKKLGVRLTDTELSPSVYKEK